MKKIVVVNTPTVLAQLITDAADDCYDIPNNHYLLQKNPGQYILDKLKAAGYDVVKQKTIEDLREDGGRV